MDVEDVVEETRTRSFGRDMLAVKIDYFMENSKNTKPNLTRL